MPQSAIENVDVDFVLKLDDIPGLLTTLAGRTAKGAKAYECRSAE
jgi:hypothetical protein